MLVSTHPRDLGGDPVIVVAGPTASGKSALALGLAEALDGEVVNADSLQLYGDLAVLTARPGAADLARAPHRLYGILDGGDACSAGRWRGMALEAIAGARRTGRRPILVGGTGLYLNALMVGLSPVPAVPAEAREAAARRHRRLGGEAFHAALAARDPAMAARLHVGDSQRLIRAWEVLEATGRSLADWQRQPPVPPPAGLRFDLVLLMPARTALHAACDRRFLAMIEAGALDEAARLGERRLEASAPIMKAVGVAELLAHLRGEMPLDRAISQAQKATRGYAKRQGTWFRHQRPRSVRIRREHVIEAQYSERLLQEILSIVR